MSKSISIYSNTYLASFAYSVIDLIILCRDCGDEFDYWLNNDYELKDNEEGDYLWDNDS